MEIQSGFKAELKGEFKGKIMREQWGIGFCNQSEEETYGEANGRKPPKKIATKRKKREKKETGKMVKEEKKKGKRRKENKTEKNEIKENRQKFQAEVLCIFLLQVYRLTLRGCTRAADRPSTAPDALCTHVEIGGTLVRRLGSRGGYE